MMPGLKLEEVRDALVDGYDQDSLTQMVRFRLNKKLDAIVAPGPFRNRAFDLLDVADQEGWDTQLICEAYRFRPGNTALLQVYEKYGLAPRITVQKAGAAQPEAISKVSSAGLQKLVRNDNPAVNINEWCRRLTDLEVRVCRVDINGGPMGTGFLVGPQVVLTNYHVVKSVLDGVHAATTLSCLFDYKVLANATSNPGERVPLLAGHEIPVHSPCTDDEFTPQPDKTLPTVEQLDFALLHLDRPMGKLPVSGPESPPRGWEALPAAAAKLIPDQGLIIVQHPRGEPMKLAIDTQSVLHLNANGTRVRYRTNTEGGSSGSPVFDMFWDLVALHHLGDPAQGHPPQYNQGVAPLYLIRAKIEGDGFGPILG
jgi:hypothetical protein